MTVGILIITSKSNDRIGYEVVEGRFGRLDDIERVIRTRAGRSPAIAIYKYISTEGGRIFIWTGRNLVDIGYATKPMWGRMLDDIATFTRAETKLKKLEEQLRVLQKKAESMYEFDLELKQEDNIKIAKMEGYLGAITDVLNYVQGEANGRGS